MLQVNDKAPLFESKDENGNTIKLESYLGKGQKVALYFYPKDSTTGCTEQACNLRDNKTDLAKAGYKVIGVSVDDPKSHIKFITKNELNFPLVSDTDHSVVEAYGVWQEKSMYGKKYMGIVRTTFIISSDGIIERIIDKVKTKDHSAQILELT